MRFSPERATLAVVAGTTMSDAVGAELVGFVSRARRRLRFMNAVAAVMRTGLVVFPAGALALLSVRAWDQPLGAQLGGALVLVGLSLVALTAFRRGPSHLSSALVLDRALGAEGAVASAYELAEERQGSAHQDSGQYGTLALRAAADRTRGRTVEGVLPLRFPKDTVPFALSLAAFVVVLAWPHARATKNPLSPRPAPRAARATQELDPESARLLDAEVQRLKAGLESQEAGQLARQYEQLVERWKGAELDRQGALAAAAALERETRAAAEAHERLDSALAKIGQALASTPALSKAGQALTEGRVKDAAAALRELAARLQDERHPPSQAELEGLRKAVEKARQEAAQAARDADTAAKTRSVTRQALEGKKDRLEKKQVAGTASPEELEELERTKRELESLDRSSASDQAALDELDQKLGELLRELGGDRKRAGEFMERAASELSRQAKKQLSREEKEALLEQLQALKERLRNESAESAEERLREFEKQARGRRSGAGESGDGSEQGGVSLVPSQRAARATGSGAVPGQPGQGSPGKGSPGSAENAAQARSGASSSEPGTQHDPHLTGETSARLDSRAHDRAAAAQDTASGTSESETILAAAEAGFVSGAYEKLYREYRTVAEEIVRGPEIPKGRRSEVERYFELIRPREP